MARRARVRASRPSRRVARVLALVVSSRLASASPPGPSLPPLAAVSDAERFAWLVGAIPSSDAATTCDGSFDATAHPEASRCAKITGSLAVTGVLPAAFTDASPTGRILTRVDGDVVVRANPVETSLRGAFPALARVGGSIILDDTRLVFLAAFPSLEDVGGDVVVQNNPRLLRFHDAHTSAFSSLRAVGGGVFLRANAARRLAGFAALRRVGARVDGGGVVIEHNPSLVDVGAPIHRARTDATNTFGAAFALLEVVRGSVVVADCASLESLDGAFRSIVTVTGSIRLHGNPSLARIDRSFALLDVVGGDVRVASCASLQLLSSSFASLRVVAGDVVFDECVTLARLDRGTLNALVAVEGSLVVRRTNLRALSNLFSLARVGGDVRVAGNPAMSSLDGLQNVRSIGGVIDAQRLEGHFGRCGRVSERFGVRHACYDRNFRFCQPLIPPGFLIHSAANIAVPGWYACVDSVATAIFAAPETRTTAAIVKAAGLVDAFQTPRAALTLFAPTDTAWVRAIGRLDGVLARGAASASAATKQPLADVVFAHVVRGVAPLASFRDGQLAHTLFAGLALRVRSGARKAPGDDVSRSSQNIKTLPASPTKLTRCAALPGVRDDCAPSPFRAVSLEPNLWLPIDAGDHLRANHLDASATEALARAFERSKENADDDSAVDDPAEDDSASHGASPPGEDTSTFATSPDEAASARGVYESWAETARATRADAAVVVLGDVKTGNGYVHFVDAPLAPAALLAPAPPPPPPSPPRQTDELPVAAFATSPPPSPGVRGAVPPPTLTPMSAYWTAPPPPAFGASPPRAPPPTTTTDPSPTGVERGSCRAKAPDICGLCDYTYQDAAGGVCCCDASCLQPENGDCCEDYLETCGDAGARGARERETTGREEWKTRET